jgi:hypothetical protein
MAIGFLIHYPVGHIVGWLPIIGGVLGGIYFGGLIFSGWNEARNAPREDMLMCSKHGIMRRKDFITLTGDDAGLYCPICFHEKLGAAERSGTLPFQR